MSPTHVSTPSPTRRAAARVARAVLPAGLALLALHGLTDGAGAAPNGSVKGTVKRDVLTVTGTAGPDDITIRLQSGTTQVVVVDVGSDGTDDLQFDRDRFSSIVVLGGAGNDRLAASFLYGTFTDAERTTLDGGDGHDTIVGANGPETLRGGRGDDFIDGQQGGDTIEGGDGTDTFQWDPGDGSDTVSGGAGTDELVFNGSSANEILQVRALDGHVRLTRNVGIITMDLDDLETLDLRAFAGADTIDIADLTGTDLTTVETDLAAFGGADDTHIDTVIVSGTPASDQIAVTDDAGAVVVQGLPATVRVTGAEPALDYLRVDGWEGDDTITATPGAEALIHLELVP